MTGKRIRSFGPILGLSAILIVAGWFRFYHLEDNLHWRGDEGRDTTIIRQMLITHRPVLTGPTTSVGTAVGPLYLGPLIYYLEAPGLWLANYSPVGPAVVTIIFSLATLVLLWLIGRQWFSPLAGWVAAGAYALSTNAILYGRHAWNPNFMPFFVLLLVWSLWRAWNGIGKWNWIIIGGSFAAVVQLHAIGWVMLIPIMAVWTLTALSRREKATTNNRRKFFVASLAGLLIFIAIMSPLIIYDLTHRGYNWRVVTSYVQERLQSPSSDLYKSAGRMLTQIPAVFEDTIVGNFPALGWASIWFIIFLILKRHRPWPTGERRALLLIGGWFICGIVALAFNPEPLMPHYRIFLWPIAWLTLGWAAWQLVRRWERYKYFWLIGWGIFLTVAGIKFMTNPNTVPPPYDYRATKQTAEIIAQTSNQRPFALTMSSLRLNYVDAYKYQVNLAGLTDVPLADANQAYVVYEDENNSSVSLKLIQKSSFVDGTIDQSWALAPAVSLIRVTRP